MACRRRKWNGASGPRAGIGCCRISHRGRSARCAANSSTNATIYGAELGIRDGKLLFPAGAIIGQHLEFFLGSLVGGAVALKSFDELPIPYRAVATDVVDGAMVILDRGNLAGAMRASMSVPGVFAPQKIEGKRLVDGGLVRNLPIDVARELGAQVIIAVNLGTPLLKPEELDTVLGITMQMINILTEQNVQMSLKQLRPDDVLILPELGNFGAGDFRHAADTIEIGERAARQVAAQLARYALPEEEYAALRAAQMARAQADQPQVDEVRVETARLRYVNPESLQAQIRTRTGDHHDPETLSRDMEALYVSDDFQQVYYRFEEQDGKRVLVVEPVEKSWGPNYLRFGLNLGTNFKGKARLLSESITAPPGSIRAGSSGATTSTSVSIQAGSQSCTSRSIWRAFGSSPLPSGSTSRRMICSSMSVPWPDI